MAKELQKKIQPKQSKEAAFDIEAKAELLIKLSTKLDKDMKKFIDVQNEIADLQKEIVKYGNDELGDEETKEVRTSEGVLKIGARNTKREITDLDSAIDMMGLETAMKLLKLSLGDLDKYLTPEQVSSVTKKTITDARRITF